MQSDDFLECRTCGETKPVDEFPFSRKSPGGNHRSTQCKICSCNRAKAYLRAKKEGVKA